MALCMHNKYEIILAKMVDERTKKKQIIDRVDGC